MKTEVSKIEKMNGIEYKYSSNWIKEIETEDHWRLYWQQQKIMQEYLKPKDKVLEIGVGSGFTANYLRSKGFEVTTFDIDEDKNPDIVGNIVAYDWSTINASHILAFEVFEHIPFNEFKTTLKKLKRSCKYIFMSVPLNERVPFEFSCKLPKCNKKTLRLPIRKNKITEPHHFGEVGYGNYSEPFVDNTINEQGYKIINKLKKLSAIFYTLETI